MSAAAAPAPSTDKLAAPTKAASPKIEAIVTSISQLTLLETADLVAQLKTRLNIGDVPMFAAGAAAAAPAANAAAAPAAVRRPSRRLSADARLRAALVGADRPIHRWGSVLMGSVPRTPSPPSLKRPSSR